MTTAAYSFAVIVIALFLLLYRTKSVRQGEGRLKKGACSMAQSRRIHRRGRQRRRRSARRLMRLRAQGPGP